MTVWEPVFLKELGNVWIIVVKRRSWTHLYFTFEGEIEAKELHRMILLGEI